MKNHLMAERVGFEPTEAFTSTVFETVAFDHSAIFPNYFYHFPENLFCPSVYATMIIPY